MIITAIAALGQNRVIGKGGRLPWHLPADLKHFKLATMGHHILMGRKTWDAFPNGALPGRVNVVISRNKAFRADGAVVFPALDQALEWVYRQGETEAFIIGGAQIYLSALAMTDRLLLTEVDAQPEGDAHFPELRESEWEETAREHHPADEKNALALDFLVLERIKKRREGLKPWRGFDY
jgi:dihydrofolate reductase